MEYFCGFQLSQVTTHQHHMRHKLGTPCGDDWTVPAGEPGGGVCLSCLSPESAGLAGASDGKALLLGVVLCCSCKFPFRQGFEFYEIHTSFFLLSYFPIPLLFLPMQGPYFQSQGLNYRQATSSLSLSLSVSVRPLFVFSRPFPSSFLSSSVSSVSSSPSFAPSLGIALAPANAGQNLFVFLFFRCFRWFSTVLRFAFFLSF